MRAQDIDFLIIGAAKSATTWLQTSLQADPAISMPDPEIHYFSRYYDRGPDWYLTQFPVADAVLRGEKSNSYLHEAVSAPRVHAMLPHARLVIQLRNPVERAYSDYCMLYRRGEVGSDICSHLKASPSGANRFLDDGLYRRQIQAYLDLYPAERILVLLYEDMIRDPDAQLRRLRGFLGRPAEAAAPVSRTKVKDRAEPMIGPRLRRMMRPFKPIARPFRQTSLFQATRSLVASEIRYPKLTSDLRNGLRDFYGPDVEDLGALIQRDLSGWLAQSSISTPLA
ncbi:sulfotransferase [Aureimonas sp. AU12]|uniref:sulfotransferase n=1 Tax=Aureimonas sp. AU12 TaxID=1638161 RepID=UPI000782B61A|nr:sulfotransferase [Aureimonas sp. AU12]